jgi:hypothetical protein
MFVYNDMGGLAGKEAIVLIRRGVVVQDITMAVS